MNMDVDYMVHKSNIQHQLQEAVQANLRSQKRGNKAKKTGKSKLAILLASLMKLVLAGK